MYSSVRRWEAVLGGGRLCWEVKGFGGRWEAVV